MFESIENFFKRPAPHPEFSFNELFSSQVAILITDGFELVEMTLPKKALEDRGATCLIVAPEEGRVRSWNKGNWSKSFDVDLTITEAWSVEFDYLLLPGGVMGPDSLRTNSEAVAFVMSFLNKKKPIAAICRGPQILIETGNIKGRKITSAPSLKTDFFNAGAQWVDQDVISDSKIITAQSPDDIPLFIDLMIQEFIEERIDQRSLFSI